jgi:hypothetical protein
MTGVVRQHRFLGASLVLVLVAMAAAHGCAGNQDRTAGVDQKQERTVGDWDSPRMREIENEWQALWDGYYEDPTRNQSKSEYGTLMMAVERLFRTRLSGRSLRQLAARSEKAPVPTVYGSPPFESGVLEFMVQTFVESGDRESLVELLSKRCPYRVGWMTTIEYFVAYSGWRFADPILIFGEAHSKCQVPETRHALAAAVRRSFAGFGIHGKDDSEFVSNAIRWYMKEKGDLIVNREYYRNENTSLPIESYEGHPEYYDKPPWPREPLFKRRTFAPGVPNLSEEADVN